MSAVTAYTKMTLIDLAKSLDPNGDVAEVAEILNESNPILQNAPWRMANNMTSHRITRRLSLPGGTWRRFNQTVAPNKGTKIQVDEPMGMLTAYSEADKDLVEMSPNAAQVRMDEAAAHLEGMSQELAGTLFYGNNGANPEEFDGLAVRMATVDNASNVYSAGGDTACTSLYVVQWSPYKAYMIYPRSHKTAGIVHDALGIQTKEDTTGLMEVYRDRYVVHCGLAITDSRSIGRIANIASGAAAGAAGSFDEDDLIDLLTGMPNEGKGSVIYVHKKVKAQMRKKLKDKSNVYFNIREGLSGPTGDMFFGDIPVRVCDQILISESVVS